MQVDLISKITPKEIGYNLFLALIYILVGKFGLSFASVNPSTSAVWPPTGLAIAVIILFGCRLWPGVLIGAFFTNLLTTGFIGSSLFIALGNTLEALLGGFLINRYASGKNVFDRVESATIFMIVAGLIAPAISATVGALTLIMVHLANWSEFGLIWLNWWLGDMGGAVLLAPLIILWFEQPKFSLTRRRFFELFCALLFIIVATQIAFGGAVPFIPTNYPITFIIIPPLLWVATRFRRRETATMIFITVILCINGSLRGHGVFAGLSPDQSLPLLQSFLVVSAISVFMLSITLTERGEANNKLFLKEKYFSALIEKNQDAITVIDEDSTVLYASPSAEALFSSSPRRLLGSLNFDFFHPDDQLTLINELANLRQKPGESFEKEARIKDNPWRYVEAVFTNFLHEPSISAFVVNYRDVTEQKKLDLKKGEFGAFISQELRRPLSAIERYSSSILTGKKQLPTLEHGYLKQINTENQNMIKLVENLMKMSRIGLGTLETHLQDLSVKSALEEALKNVNQLITGKRVKIERIYKNPDLMTNNDRGLVISIISTFLALVLNRVRARGTLSLKLMKQKERALLKISVRPKLPKKINKLISQNHEEAELFVVKALAAYIGVTVMDELEKAGGGVTLVI